MDIVEFIEKGLNYRLFEYQKNLLYKVEQNPNNYTIRLQPLPRTNMCRIMSVKEKERSDIHTSHEGYYADFIFIDELEPENKKEN